jgi:hypothetical protein
MRTDTAEKVLEKLATSDKTTIVIERLPDGKMLVTSGSCDREKLILRDQALELRNVAGRVHIASKPRRLQRVGPGCPTQHPHRPGPRVSAYAGDEAIVD